MRRSSRRSRDKETSCSDCAKVFDNIFFLAIQDIVYKGPWR